MNINFRISLLTLGLVTAGFAQAAVNGPRAGSSGSPPNPKVAVTPVAQAQIPINAKATINKLTLKGGAVFPAGSVALYSTISLSGQTSTCMLTYTVTTANEGNGAINFELFRANFNGGFETATSTEYNPGAITIAQGGKFRAAITARSESMTLSQQHHTGGGSGCVPEYAADPAVS